MTDTNQKQDYSPTEPGYKAVPIGDSDRFWFGFSVAYTTVRSINRPPKTAPIQIVNKPVSGLRILRNISYYIKSVFPFYVSIFCMKFYADVLLTLVYFLSPSRA